MESDAAAAVTFSAVHGGRQVGAPQQVLITQRQSGGQSALAVQGTQSPCTPQKPLPSMVLKQVHSGLSSQPRAWKPVLEQHVKAQLHLPLSTGRPPRLRHRSCPSVRASACPGKKVPMAKAKALAPIDFSTPRREMEPLASPLASSSKDWLVVCWLTCFPLSPKGGTRGLAPPVS
jgi:hypothetical protein